MEIGVLKIVQNEKYIYIYFICKNGVQLKRISRRQIEHELAKRNSGVYYQVISGQGHTIISEYYKKRKTYQSINIYEIIKLEFCIFLKIG